jgi:hypothetical protein
MPERPGFVGRSASKESASAVTRHLPTKPCRFLKPNPHLPKQVNRLPGGCLVERTAKPTGQQIVCSTPTVKRGGASSPP